MNELREEALRMVAELTGDSIGYTKMQIGMKGHFVTLETAAVSMAERALKAELANREQKVTLADRDNHIDLAYKALGDVNRSVYLFDHIREQKAEIDRLRKEVQSALSDLAELPRLIAEINQSHVTELASLRASAGEKWKPIESAPKDQSVFLGRKGNIIYMTQSSKSYVKWPHEEGGPTFRDEWNMIEYDAVSPWSPTHWAEIEPLPVAPTLPAEEK